MKQFWEQKELNALITCREKASELKISDAKFIKAEYSFDGAQLTFMYATEDKKLDVRPLRKRLNRHHAKEFMSSHQNCKRQTPKRLPRNVSAHLLP